MAYGSRRLRCFVRFPPGDLPGEGGDISLTQCHSDYLGLGEACLIEDSFFRNSGVGNKGAVLQVGTDDYSNVEVNRCHVADVTCGAVSLRVPRISSKICVCEYTVGQA